MRALEERPADRAAQRDGRAGTAERARRRLPGRLSGLAVALAAAALLLGACGDDAGEDLADDAAAAADEVADNAGEAAEDVAENAEETADEVADGADTDEIDAGAGALADALRDNGMTTLASAVEQIDVDELIGGETFTFFGPNDEAFLALTADDTADLLADPTALTDVLRNHLVAETIGAAELTEMATVTTLSGTSLPVVVDGDTVTVGGATVVATDIEAGDGVVHTIDQVILP